MRGSDHHSALKNPIQTGPKKKVCKKEALNKKQRRQRNLLIILQSEEQGTEKEFTEK